MAALTAPRDTRKLGDNVELHNRPVAAATKIWQGSLVCLNAAGNAVPGSTASTLTAIGRAVENIDNLAGAAGDKRIEIVSGIFNWNNSASADQITIADVGKPCYVVDDQTVAKTSNSSARSQAGVVYQVDADGTVWVQITLVAARA